MKVFISSDIEGVACTTVWDNATRGAFGYEEARRQMTLEVAAACEGAHEAGADYIRVKDAHGSGMNLILDLLPEYVEITRHSCGSPWSMVYGVNEGFDAAMYVGYHCAAGQEGNPLSHTETKNPFYVKLNGEYCSEFRLYSFAAAMAGVPSVFLSGDERLCDDSKLLHPRLITVPVKKGYGGLTTCLHPRTACGRIREGAKLALSQPLDGALIEIPKHFELEICYKEHEKAVKASFFPGFAKIDDNTVIMRTDNYMDVLTAVAWVL